jgi:glycine dehydrogenase
MTDSLVETSLPSVDHLHGSASSNGGSVATRSSVTELTQTVRFAQRHIGPNAQEIQMMLEALDLKSLEALADKAVPASIRLKSSLKLAPAASESEALGMLRAIANQNQVFRSYIGLGYSGCITPPVIQRNILENPGWYTQYTPYQAEIAQGRLEALLNYQTMVTDLTGLEIANASLLDEGTAAAEAMAMCFNLTKKKNAKTFFVSETCHPQTIAVIRTRAVPLEIEVVVGDHKTCELSDATFGGLLQYPATDGTVHDYRAFAEKAHASGALVIVAADLLSLTLLTPPGEFGADIAVGNTQRLGVPFGYGGPHAAYFATKDAFKRQIPGRIVGVSHDAQGNTALRLALQTREQHIRRDKATSNICTAQVLLAVMASMYAVYHGPTGLKQIAHRTHQLTCLLAKGLSRLGYAVKTERFFDTIQVDLGATTWGELEGRSQSHRINFRPIDEHTVGISLDETVMLQDVQDILTVFAGDTALDFTLESLIDTLGSDYAAPFAQRVPDSSSI